MGVYVGQILDNYISEGSAVVPDLSADEVQNIVLVHRMDWNSVSAGVHAEIQSLHDFGMCEVVEPQKITRGAIAPGATLVASSATTALSTHEYAHKSSLGCGSVKICSHLRQSLQQCILYLA